MWRDILCEGPVAASIDDPADRGAYLARLLDIDAAEYVAGWREAHAALARAADHDEIVLWFEQDLFCAVNLWYVLSRLAGVRAALTLVYPSLDELRGLGTVGPAHLRGLFSGRAALTAAAVAEAREAWLAYAIATPMAAQDLAYAGEGVLPFVAAAMRRHLARLPALTTGLGEITAREPVRRHGMGDWQLAATLRALASGTPPLVSISGGAIAACSEWRVEATAEGRAVIAGERAWSPRPRWVGGVRIDAHPGWRRDGDRVVLTG